MLACFLGGREFFEAICRLSEQFDWPLVYSHLSPMTKEPKNRQDHLREQLAGFRTLTNIAAPFSSTARQAKADIAKLQAQMNELSQAQAVFTERYAPDGWSLFAGMATPTMVDLVHVTKEEGTSILTSYHLEPQTLQALWQRLKSERMRPWFDIYSTARERAEAGDFVSAVPLVLLIIDGIVTKLTGKHAFSGGTDAPVFDTLASGPGGIAELLQLLGRQRGSVTTEPLEAPFRHGIMHGMDLNFGHAIVAAKAFNALHAVVDYCERKADEKERVAKALEEQRVPPIRETLKGIAETAKITTAIDNWSARPLRAFEDGASQEELAAFIDGSPEAATVAYLQALSQGNFGRIAAHTVDFLKRPIGERAKDFKARLIGVESCEWHILQIKDEAPAVSEVQAHVWGTSEGRSWSYKGTIRLIYGGDDDKSAVYGAESGRWKAIEYFLSKLDATILLGGTTDDRT